MLTCFVSIPVLVCSIRPSELSRSPSHTVLTWKRNRDTLWQRESREWGQGGVMEQAGGGAEGRNKEEVCKDRGRGEKARGRREMPDGGTRTQHEWRLIAEGWMLGRRGEKTGPGNQRRMRVMRWDDKKERLSSRLHSPICGCSPSSPFLEMSLANSWLRLFRTSASSRGWL